MKTIFICSFYNFGWLKRDFQYLYVNHSSHNSSKDWAKPINPVKIPITEYCSYRQNIRWIHAGSSITPKQRLTNTELSNEAKSKNNAEPLYQRSANAKYENHLDSPSYERLQARVSPAFNTAIGIFKLSLMVCTSTTLNSSSLASAPNKI
ncbi:hypothetical protein GQX74_001989 [Glossina fuscipes]|nr:hypothetical protein GQX74_001989 [Glossina fuscipes]